MEIWIIIKITILDIMGEKILVIEKMMILVQITIQCIRKIKRKKIWTINNNIQVIHTIIITIIVIII